VQTYLVTTPAGDDRVATLTRTGLAAALAVARQHKLPADDPRILSSRGNLLVQLAPAPVVARVATLTAWTRHDPFSWLANEVAVAGYAAGQDGPIVPPTDLADPGPHRSEGFAVSLFAYRRPEPEKPAPAEVGTALARLHIALTGFAGDLPALSARAQIAEALAALERDQVLDDATVAALRRRRDAVFAELDAAADAGRAGVVLHGDAHPGNLMRSGGQWLWLDLEETCRGPRHWDLAVLARSQAAAADEALAAYAAETGTAVPGPDELAPYLRARELEGAVWSLAMAHQYPARYREPARTLLGSVLGRPAT
jgi:hypothetical protein